LIQLQAAWRLERRNRSPVETPHGASHPTSPQCLLEDASLTTPQPTPADAQPTLRQRPWHLLWVLAALVFASMSLSEFRATGRLAAAMTLVGWICWAFSWYVKPFSVRWRAPVDQAVQGRTLHERIPPGVWALVTFCGVVFLILGLVLKLLKAT
jgi:hypothetical protein